MEFDHDIACRAIGGATGIPPEQVKAVVFDSGSEVNYETGLTNCDQFHQYFCETTKTDLGKSEFLRHIGDIFTPNQQMFPLLTQLKSQNFPMGILSNTCPAHWDFVIETFTVVREFFEPLILSYQVNAMKPDPKIYDRAIEQAGCQTKKCFFVDDRQENVDGALTAGMDAVLYTSVPNLIRDLELRGVEVNL